MTVVQGCPGPCRNQHGNASKGHAAQSSETCLEQGPSSDVFVDPSLQKSRAMHVSDSPDGAGGSPTKLFSRTPAEKVAAGLQVLLLHKHLPPLVLLRALCACILAVRQGLRGFPHLALQSCLPPSAATCVKASVSVFRPSVLCLDLPTMAPERQSAPFATPFATLFVTFQHILTLQDMLAQFQLYGVLISRDVL